MQQYIDILEKNLNAHEIKSGYTQDIGIAIAALHKEWFNSDVSLNCRDCVISAANRVFSYYKNTYKPKHEPTT